MAGYDLSSKNPYRLIKGRLGVYDKRPFEEMSVEGINDQAMKLRQMGGNRQQERMILSKRRSLDRAVWSSYQAAEVIRIDAEYRKPVRCLINPNKLKQDYDDKIISIGYEYNFKVGDVFEWLGTKTHWLIYLQDLTELAYFRGDIRKCSYEIAWEDENGLHKTYAAIRGPVETKINYIQKHGISVDTPSYSLNILLPKNEDTLSYFQRYNKFYLQNTDSETAKICWRIEATDTISMPNIIEINAVEYYANETEDDVAAGLVGALIVTPEDPNEEDIDTIIVGKTFIKPKREAIYSYRGVSEGNWKIDSQLPVSSDEFIDEEGYPAVRVKWTSSYSGQFTLSYGDFEKVIVVESLF